MGSESSRRALDFMRCALPEQRRSSRVHLPIRATVVFPVSGAAAQTAFLRDVNMLGAFFYCRQKASVGQTVRLEFGLPDDAGTITAICEGAILRVEESAPGAAIGIAVEFTRCELTRPKRAEQVPAQEEQTPFIAWTVDVVERIFVKSQQLRISNRECGQAA